MDLADRIRELAARIPTQRPHIRTEEATKNALIMPFIAALGYNVFDPLEVTPELDADVGLKKGEKVDYAILKDGKPIILFECKPCSANLDDTHASQLYRYFSVTSARVAILTNGVLYRFFSDIDEPNKMDAKPFFELDMLDLDDFMLTELKKFSKGLFDAEHVLADANEMKFTREIKRLLNQEFAQPTEDFVRFFAGRVYAGRMTQAVREAFTEITKKALHQFISEKVADRLKLALAKEEASAKPVEPTEPVAADADEIVTTAEELQAFYIVQAILSQVVDPARIVMRDQKSYCAILLDDNNRKTLCRLRFSATQKHVSLFDAEKNESRVALGPLTDLFGVAPQLRQTVERFLGAAA